MVVGLDTKVPLADGNYVTAINFDNAATTPPFFSVMNEIANYAPWYSSVHRGKGYKSIVSSDLYEEGREVIRKFVKATDPEDVVVFTKNTTEAINLVSYMLADTTKEQVVLSTDMEHLANDLPWQGKFRVDYAGVDQNGQLSIADLENKLQRYRGKVVLVAVSGASNVTGYINPIHALARLAHQYAAKILVEGAQLAPHASVEIRAQDSPDHIDYFAFSAHKMYAPFGAGALIAPRKTLERAVPLYQGGGNVWLVSRQCVEWHVPPAKHEAGTPNMMGVIAMMAAVKTLSQVGMDRIHDYERQLIDYAIAGLSCIPGITLYSCNGPKENRVSLISFTMEDISHDLLAEILSLEAGIAVRNGLFCAHPYVEKLLHISEEELAYYHNNHDAPVPGLVRISFGLYNNRREIDVLLELLWRITKSKSEYKKKYEAVARQKGHAITDNYSASC